MRKVVRFVCEASQHCRLQIAFVVLLTFCSAVGAGVGRLNFESPVATNGVTITPDGARILVVNPANGTLSVIDAASRALVAEVPVGLQPVSVAVHPGGGFAYVANHVSDSVSVVDLTLLTVVATVQDVVPAASADAGRTRFDEPSQVLFSADGARAFVTLAQTNELAVVDTTTHGVVARVDFNGTLLAPPLGSRVFLSAPRAMALVGANYLAVAGSGGENRTETNFDGPVSPPTPDSLAASIRTDHRCFQGSSACVTPSLTGPLCAQRCAAEAAPRERWIATNPSLPDPDMVVLDLTTLEPVALLDRSSSLIHGVASGPGEVVGTWRLFVAHTDAQNVRAGLGNLDGRPYWNRLTEAVFEPSAGLSGFSKVDLDAPTSMTPLPSEPAAIPSALAISADGQTRYVTASGSGRLLVVDASGGVQARLVVGSHPTSLALNLVRDEAYVFNRVDGTLSIVDLSAAPQVVATISAGTDVLSPQLRVGARVIHDSSLSANGSFACASCHPSVETDRLPWELDPTTNEEAGPRTTQSLRGLAGSAGFHWDGKFASLAELVSGTVDSVMGGSVTAADAAAAEAYLLSIPHLPSPTRAPGDRLSDAAKAGIRTFFSHASQGQTSCAAASCHAPPTWSSSTKHARLEAPSLRALYDRRASLHDGVAIKQSFVILHDNTFDIFDGVIDWEAALRATLISELGEAFVPKHDDLIEWLQEMSTGLPAAIGRQVTLTQSSRQDATVQEIEAQLWQEADDAKVQLVATGVVRANPASPWEPLQLSWDAATQVFQGVAGASSRLALEATIDAADAIVTYTAQLWSEGEQPIPELHALCEGCSTPLIGELVQWDPTQPHRLTLFGRGFEPDLRVLLDGAPIAETVTVVSTSEAFVDFADMYGHCGDVSVFQVQNNNSRLSNEVPLENLSKPANDAGPDVVVCMGTLATIGTSGLSGIDYRWTPTTNLGAPLAAMTTVATPAAGTFVYSRVATITGTECSSSEPVRVAVLASGMPAESGNGYRLIKSGGDVQHLWDPVAGGATMTLIASPDKFGSSPTPLTVAPMSSASWTESAGLGGQTKFYTMQASACP